MMPSPFKKFACRGNPAIFTMAATVLWVLAIASSLVWINNHTSSPGNTGVIPAHWPADSRIVLDAHRPTLILFAHPHCPCTAATVRELERLMAVCQGQVNAQVWFIKPAGTSNDWTNTALWHVAASIPGVTVHCDEAGGEGRRFAALTSGQTVLYDQQGRLLFQGGITISRGHEGDNPGLADLAATLNHESPAQIQTPVFGCPLFGAHCPPVKGDVLCQP